MSRFLELELRARLAESWARMYLGDVPGAIEVLARARSLVESAGFTDADRGNVLYRLGCCRSSSNSVTTAIGLFTEASGSATARAYSDRLRAHILEWRSRCYQRQRDWEAAREDVERALELAEGLNDRTPSPTRTSRPRSSPSAPASGACRSYAERAKAQYEEIADR